MKYLVFLFLVIFKLQVYSSDEFNMIDGPRYGIQVLSEDTPAKAYKVFGKYREFANPFLYKTRIEVCENKKPQKCSGNCKSEKICKKQLMHRVIVGIYSSKEQALEKLKEFKQKKPELFNKAFIQQVVE